MELLDKTRVLIYFSYPSPAVHFPPPVSPLFSDYRPSRTLQIALIPLRFVFLWSFVVPFTAPVIRK